MFGILTKSHDTPVYNISDEHLWVDYIELSCCRSGELTESEIKNLISPKNEDLNINLRDEGTFSSSENRDKYELRFDEYVNHLELRKSQLEESYPFHVEDGYIKLKEKLTDEQLGYIYLLFCSHLSFIDVSKRQVLTSDFEELSSSLIKSYFNNDSQVFNFGKNSLKETSRYSGNLKTKLQKLSEDFGCLLMPVDFSINNSGDGGIDLVGWFGPWDSLNGKIIIIAQCKCSNEWSNARDALSYLKSYLYLTNEVNNFFFIPYVFRKTNGEWHQRQHSNHKILIDRFRFFFNFPLDTFINSNSYNFLKQ